MKTTEKYTRDGITIRKRYNNPGAVFYTRMSVQGKTKMISLCETAEKSFEKARQARRERGAEGTWQAFKVATAPRGKPACATLREVVALYDQFPGDIKPSTKVQNTHALSAMVCEVRNVQPGTLNAWSSMRLDELTGDFVRQWKRLVDHRVAGQADERKAQLYRSASSRLLQARSLFACSRRNDLPEWYRENGIVLPASVAEFCAVPGFKTVRKTNYHEPHTLIIVTTLAALDQPDGAEGTPDRNVKIACWLAIGFGLRASEIARARVGDFTVRADGVYFNPIWFAKNGDIPLICCQLDAWKRLAPHITGRPAADFVLRGSMTARTSDLPRRVSAWFKRMGWETSHHLHELRAWAGCKIAEGNSRTDQNWEAARRFLRHAQIATTQTFYGHHFRAKIETVSLPDFAKFP